MTIDQVALMRLSFEVANRAQDEPFLPKEHVIVTDGRVRSKSGFFILDAQAARSVIAEFNSHGAEVVIDYEHQTLGGPYASPTGQAEAAGWIKDLRYEPGKGLLGTVHWLARAADQIRTLAYRYMSPVLLVDKRTHRVRALHSAALTNKPAIPNAPELLQAASDDLARRLYAMAEEPQNEDTGQSVDTLIVSIRELLSLPEDAAPEDVLSAAIEALKAAQASDTESVAASVAKALGLKADANATEVVTAVAKLKDTTVSKNVHVDMGNRLQAMKEDHGRVVQRLVNSQTEQLLEKYTQAGKLTQAMYDLHKEELTANCTGLDDFEKRAARFEKHMAVAPKAIPQGATGSPTSNGPADRETLINKAAGEYEADPAHGEVTSKVDFISLALRDASMAKLNDKERERFDVVVA